MTIETNEKQIGRATYRVRQLGAAASLRLMTRVFKVIGPAVAEAMRGVDRKTLGKQGLSELSVEAVGNAMRDLAERLTEQDIASILEIAAPQIEYSEDNWKHTLQLAADRDLHLFAGRTLELLRVLRFFFEVNYADFFGELGGLVARATAASGADSSASQKASTGESTE